MRESSAKAAERWEMLDLVQQAYPEFVPFLVVVMNELGFSTTEIQISIAEFLVYGPAYLMIQAQRGQAKTTVAAAYAVWCLIHNPSLRVMIISAGGKQANEISTLVVRIILSMDELECMRPDRNAGDRTSTEAFDVHHSLKGLDKSPSVRCEGADSNIQGARADLLIADDIESGKNSKTEHLREAILAITRDFTSICSDGRIIYLGTPQSMNSIYNTLPGRGYTVRIWPGRYPTQDQLANYGDMLAPIIKERLARDPSLGIGGGIDGKQGRPVDEELPAGREEKLQYKELDQGTAYFQLQHMLNTKLADAERFPLQTKRIISVYIAGDTFPLTIRPSLIPTDVVKYEACGVTYTFAAPSGMSQEQSKLQGTIMYVDPAGGGKNGDETAYAVVGFLNSTVWVLAVGGIAGGFSESGYTTLTALAAKWQVNRILVEKNFGNGAYLNAWLPNLRAGYKRVNDTSKAAGCALEEVWESGQKELRIIDVLEPVLGRGSLVFNADIMSGENESVARYAQSQRGSYSLLQQLSTITRDKNSLHHDDRVDALAGAVRYWVQLLGIDQAKVIAKIRAEEIRKWQANPLGIPGLNTQKRGGNIFAKRRAN